MPGRKLCIVTANVNQNTKEYGLVTIPIASDLTKIAQSVGFSLINQIIWNKNGTGGRWGSSTSQRPIFGSYPYPPNLLFKNVNEYIIIVQKPDPKKKKMYLLAAISCFRHMPYQIIHISIFNSFNCWDRSRRGWCRCSWGWCSAEC